MAFCDLNQDMYIAEAMVKHVVKRVLELLPDEMSFFNQFVEVGLLDKLHNLLNSQFERITHKEAIDILLQSGVKFEHEPMHGCDFFSEHEKYLTETHFKKPVFVTNWPKNIKAFYMRLNDDNETVAAVDLLVPGSGELIGGSQREERLDYLVKRMDELNIPKESFTWYLDLRRYGGCVHSGFGLGLERLIMYLTGIENIRDVIPYARTPKNCEF
jgi:asparaginyl-tRNA synthetase